ncbi:MAG: hypothetical protein HY894_05955 [Deltaproteobacteria bacterium]|nr:hypothetical protein [Deltaproteobacteria bacterium]
MKKIILGFFLGVVILVVFLYFGGARWLRSFASSTERAGERLEQYEKRLHDSTKDAEKAGAAAIEKTKDTVRKYTP